ncbi:MAG: hypothetical protein DDT32_01627 [Syntrophomonadaceae bacterium]|nr:hypothetical protein [Bacillota bacterium]MBT9147861.1 hypothetical protein [Bacillota bacterium]
MNGEKATFINYDESSDVLYIVTKEGEEEEFVEIAPGISVELDSNREVIGFEILNASRFLNPVLKPLYLKAMQLR